MSSSSARLQGHVAIVTGAASGIGRSIALGVAAASADVVAVDRDDRSLQDTASLHDGASSLIPIAADVSEAGAAASTVAAATGRFGKLSMLVCCAAAFTRTPFVATDDDAWAHILAVNVVGYASFVREGARAMAANGDGRIVLVSSINGHIGSPAAVAYSASKAALHNMVKSLAPQLGPRGIRINSISPGVIQTNMNAARLSSDAARQQEIDAIPRGRLGLPSDISNAAVFLLGDDADYITGADLVVDGGTMHSPVGRASRAATLPEDE